MRFEYRAERREAYCVSDKLADHERVLRTFRAERLLYLETVDDLDPAIVEAEIDEILDTLDEADVDVCRTNNLLGVTDRNPAVYVEDPLGSTSN